MNGFTSESFQLIFFYCNFLKTLPRLSFITKSAMLSPGVLSLFIITRCLP